MDSKETLAILEEGIRQTIAELRDLHPLESPELWDAKVSQIDALRGAIFVLFPEDAKRWRLGRGAV